SLASATVDALDDIVARVLGSARRTPRILDAGLERIANLPRPFSELFLGALPRGRTELTKRFAFLDAPEHERAAGGANEDAPHDRPAVVRFPVVQASVVQASHAFMRLAYRQMVGDHANTFQRSHLVQEVLVLIRQDVTAQINMAVVDRARDHLRVR